ncbi:MAG: DUF1501 domain-containing protein [Planctomyces sp.]|nr:DUF1501 domain-containing protein [Planctomyces sp.]
MFPVPKSGPGCHIEDFERGRFPEEQTVLEIRSGFQGNRRAVLKAGMLSMAGLTLAGRERLIAEGAARRNNKRVILLWLDGGPSQLESYDPKPEAPAEFRGPFGAISTKVAGTQFSELMAEQAKFADQISVIRSMRHGTGDHFAGAHWMLTGRFGATTASKSIRYPSLGSCISKLCGPRNPGLPAYVGLPAAESVYLFPGYQGAAYLGGAYEPFDVSTDVRYLHHTYKTKVESPVCFKASGGIDESRAKARSGLMASLDQLRRDVDNTGMMEAMDAHHQSAMSLVFGGAAVNAFDISKERPEVAARYGDTPWGQYTLMARRLVESGVTFVTVDMPHWDHHSSLVDGHAPNMRVMDQCVGALMSDLTERGLLDEVIVLVMGEFGRTPRINQGQPGIPIPGRDHWGDAFSVMIAGGGVRPGVVVGSTNARAEYPVEREVAPHDLLATIYRLLDIDPAMHFPDFAGRPVALVDRPEGIRELLPA